MFTYWWEGPGSSWSQGMVWPASQDHSFLSSGVSPLVAEAGLETCAGFLERRASACPLVGRAGSWPSGGQGCVQRQLWALQSFGSLSADGWGWVPAHLVVWPELSQPWCLQATGCWVGPGLDPNELQQVQ